MKKIMRLLLAVVISVFLAGCQATPEKEIVIQKDLEQMIEKAQETPDTTAGTLAERLGAQDTYQSTFSNAKGNVTVYVDAPVVLT
jgi:PBP1b-binding outer membrane lipoprotein LpoB